MTLKTAKSKNVKGSDGHAHKAYLGIRSMMFHNEIVPGQRISYRELAERLEMSQTPVIQALKLLEVQRLVTHEPNRGYFTAPISLQEVEEIYELRELIELELLSKSFRQIDANGIQKLRLALQAHKDTPREVYFVDRLLKDAEFHLTFGTLSGSKVHKQMLASLFDLLYLKYGYNILFSTSMDSVEADHKELFDCVTAADLKGARKSLRQHIRRVKRHVLENLQRIAQSKRMSNI